MIIKATEFIKLGKVVAFPTETVYGLGADATNEEACQKIFKLKGRPVINPLIVHVASFAHAESIGKFNDDALKLSKAFWPGPLSIVVPLKTRKNIAKSVLAGLSTVALRIPSHKVAIELLKRSKVPIAAPSANPSGYISATNIEHVKEHFANKEDVFILESMSSYLNIAKYGLESTIVDTTTRTPHVLRDGFITLETLEKILGKKVTKAPSLMQIKAPGMMDQHYAPKVPVRPYAENLKPNEIGLNFANSNLYGNFSLNLSAAGNLIEVAANFYSMLRILDNYAILNKMAGIAVAPIPEIGIGVAINDRLKRAAR